MKKPATVVIAVLAILFAAAPATAMETAAISIESTPLKGQLFRDVPRPVNSSVTVKFTPDAPEVTPLKVANITFPREMSFNPHNDVTPVCPESRVGPTTDLSLGTAGVVALCPESVIGTGTSTIFVARQAASPLSDPQLVVFNAGRTDAGLAKISIYGYSKMVGAGVLMQGALQPSGQLKVDVAPLAFDSAVKEFTIGMPGETIEFDDSASPTGKSTAKGLDPNYLQATCKTGNWTAKGDFTMGKRDAATGVPISEEYKIVADPYQLGCTGQRGQAKLKLKVSGPRKLRHGALGTYRLQIMNRGTADATRIQVTAQGGLRGSVSAGTVEAGSRKVIKVRAKAKGKPGSSKRGVFKVKASNAFAKASVPLKVRRG